MLFYLELSAFVGTRCLGYGVHKSSNHHRRLICLELFSVSVSYKPREFDKFYHVRFPAKRCDVFRSAILFIWVFFWHMKVCFSGHRWAPKSSAHNWKLQQLARHPRPASSISWTLCLCSTEGPTGQCGLSVSYGGKWVPLLKKYPWKWHFQREFQHSLTQRSNCKMHGNHISCPLGVPFVSSWESHTFAVRGHRMDRDLEWELSTFLMPEAWTLFGKFTKILDHMNTLLGPLVALERGVQADERPEKLRLH